MALLPREIIDLELEEIFGKRSISKDVNLAGVCYVSYLKVQEVYFDESSSFPQRSKLNKAGGFSEGFSSCSSLEDETQSDVKARTRREEVNLSLMGSTNIIAHQRMNNTYQGPVLYKTISEAVNAMFKSKVYRTLVFKAENKLSRTSRGYIATISTLDEKLRRREDQHVIVARIRDEYIRR